MPCSFWPSASRSWQPPSHFGSWLAVWSLPCSLWPSVTRSGWSASHHAFSPLPWYLLPPPLLAMRGLDFLVLFCSCSFLPGLSPACSPWLLGLWPELLWLSWASVWVALPVRSFLFWVFLNRFLHCRRSLLGFGLSCPSVRASVRVAAWMFVFEATFPLRFMYSVQSNRPRLQILRVWGPGGGVGYRPSLAKCWCRHSLTKIN